MFDKTDIEAARQLLTLCRERRVKLAVAESCTGGLLGSLITEVPGASDVFDCGVVTYSNAAKETLLGVSAAALQGYGAVSEVVARAMSEGVLARSTAHVALAITGMAGPGSISTEKPAGLVFIAVSTREETEVERNLFSGSRSEVRLQSVRRAVAMATVALDRLRGRPA